MTKLNIICFISKVIKILLEDLSFIDDRKVNKKNHSIYYILVIN